MSDYRLDCYRRDGYMGYHGLYADGCLSHVDDRRLHRYRSDGYVRDNGLDGQGGDKLVGDHGLNCNWFDDRRQNVRSDQEW